MSSSPVYLDGTFFFEVSAGAFEVTLHAFGSEDPLFTSSVVELRTSDELYPPEIDGIELCSLLRMFDVEVIDATTRLVLENANLSFDCGIELCGKDEQGRHVAEHRGRFRVAAASETLDAFAFASGHRTARIQFIPGSQVVALDDATEVELVLASGVALPSAEARLTAELTLEEAETSPGSYRAVRFFGQSSLEARFDSRGRAMIELGTPGRYRCEFKISYSTSTKSFAGRVASRDALVELRSDVAPVVLAPELESYDALLAQMR